ncbi:LacI family transcriptional regulator, partial [Rhizobium leguminosarum]
AGSRRSALERLSGAIPVVCFDNPSGADLPYVGNDNAQSMAAIVQYLCLSGEPPIFLEIPHLTENAGERPESSRATMARAGHTPLVIAC